MPVDLSMIGLDGQQAYATRMATLAQASTMQANARKTNQDVDDAQRMQALSDKAAQAIQDVVHRNPGATEPDPQQTADNMTSYADPIETAANVFMRGGAIQTGIEMLGKASTIRKQEADIQDGIVTREQNRLENIQKGAAIVGTKLGKAKNQAEWDQGMREVEQAGVIEPHLMAQLKSMPYDPDVAAYFFDQAVSAGDQAKLDLERQTAARLTDQAKITATQGQQRIEIERARTKEQARHNAVIEKAGGKDAGVPAPNSDLIKMANNSLKNTIFRDTGPESANDLKVAADYVAATAQQLVRQNKGIDYATAIQQATMRAQQSGAFSITDAQNGFFGTSVGASPKTVKFSADGLKPETAIPMPPGIKTAADASKTLKKGKYYNTVRGPAKWTGQAWEQ